MSPHESWYHYPDEDEIGADAASERETLETS
jgi:hypothetical protein